MRKGALTFEVQQGLFLQPRAQRRQENELNPNIEFRNPKFIPKGQDIECPELK
jgi:hypothetical protein